MNYTLAVGTRDPLAFQASSDGEASAVAARLVRQHFADDLVRNPQEAVTLLGPAGLVTASGERLDAFVGRAEGLSVGSSQTVAPGQTDAPDCNGS